MFKTAICYFSGSGNSFDVSLELCKYIDVESVYYIPNLDKRKLKDFQEIIIVSPVYQFNIPKLVQDFIRNLNSDSRYYVVLNGGGFYGSAVKTVKKLFKENKCQLGAIHTLQMPISFTAVIPQPKVMVDSVFKRANKKIRKIANTITKNENDTVDLKRVSKMTQYVGYSSLSNNLSADTSCNQCLKCLEICPTQNIRLYQGKIEFYQKCIGCMACYNRCESILYNGKKRKMYTNPNVDFRLMK